MTGFRPAPAAERAAAQLWQQREKIGAAFEVRAVEPNRFVAAVMPHGERVVEPALAPAAAGAAPDIYQQSALPRPDRERIPTLADVDHDSFAGEQPMLPVVIERKQGWSSPPLEEPPPGPHYRSRNGDLGLKSG
jgi:hypothetical protein